MNGVNRVLADTNSLIYLDQGNTEVKSLMAGKDVFISFVTEIELLGYSGLTRQKQQELKTMIDEMYVIEMNNLQKQICIALRQKHKLKTPDAIIAAAAIEKNIPLITADKIFSKYPVSTVY